MYISVFYENIDNLESKLEFYSVILITFMHEVLGHVLMRIQQHLYDRNIKSPETTDQKYSLYSRTRKRESGEFLHFELFGKLLKALTIKELFFIFNIENYKISYKSFREQFSKCNNGNIAKIPEILSDLCSEKLEFEKIKIINLEIYNLFKNPIEKIRLLKRGLSWCKLLDL